MRFNTSSSKTISTPVTEVAMPAFSLNALTLCLFSLGATFGGSAQAETWSFNANRTEDIGDQRREIDGLSVSNSTTGTIVGAGGTLVYNGSANMEIGANGANTTSTLDMSGLSNFVFDNATGTMVISGRRSGGATNSTDRSHGIVNLAGETNTLTASVLGVGSTSRAVQGPGINTGVLNLGQKNIFNVDSLILGANQGSGTLTFNANVSDGTLKLRGANGLDAVNNIDIATGVLSNYSGSTGTFDTTTGTLDAKVDTLTVGTARFGSQPARGAFNMGAGLLEVNNIILGQSNRTTGSGTVVANLSASNGGVIKANTITMGDIIGGPGGMVSQVAVQSGAILRAGTILAGNGNGTRQISIHTGTLANLNADADMQSDVAIALNGRGTFLTEGADSTMTLSGVISSLSTLIKTGEGVLALTGTNTWSGGSQIEQGTLSFARGANLGTGTVNLNGGKLLWQTGNTADISNRLTVGSNGGIIDDNGNDLTFSSGLTGNGGALVKQGSGTLTLTGDNNWNGATVITNGAVQIGNGGTSGNVLGDIVNNSQLILNRADVLALTNNVAGSGTLIQRGSGTSVITGNIAHAGGTQIEAGNLQVGDGGTQGNLDGNVQIASGSALLVNRVDAALLSGVISGQGRFEQMGAGTTVLSADNSWSGGTIISSGTLQIGNGGTSGSVVGDILNDGTLQFNRSDDVSLSNQVTGSGDVVQLGSGKLTLNGDQVYTGATRVENGTLQINGSVQSDTAIAAAGTLTGEMKVVGSLTNSGTLRPGTIGAADYRTVTVVGDYIGNDGVLALNSWLGADDSPSDQLVLDGGHASGTTRVAITNTNSGEAYTYADGIKVIDAINGATTDDDAFRLAGDTRSGALSYRLFRGSLSGSETDSWYLRNQFIVGPVEPEPTDPVDPVEPISPVDPIEPDEPGEGGDVVEPTNPTRPGTELPLTPPPAVLPPGEYPVIGPAVATYGVVQPIARELGMLTLGTRDQRSGDAAMMANSGTEQGPAMWTRLLASEIDHGYQAFAAPTAKGTLGGLQIGADIWQGSIIEGHDERFGLYVAQTRANISVSGLVTNEAGTQYERQNTGKVKLTGTSVGGYWTHVGPGNSYLDATLQGTRYRGTASSESGSLDMTGYGVAASLETCYPFALPAFGPGFTLEPQAQLIWQETRFKDSADRQSSVALGKTTGTTGRVGLRAKWSIETASGAMVEPFASVNYWQDWNGRATTVYDGVDRAPLASSAGRISTEVGVGTGLTTNLKVHGALGYQTGASSSSLEKRESYSVGLGLRYSF